MAVVYFGQNDNGNGSGSRTSGYLKGCLFENTAGNGTLTEVGINLAANLTGNIKIGVYADNSGSPGARLLDCGELVNPITGWNLLTGLSLSVTAGTYYWLAWVNSAAATVYHNTTYNLSWKSTTYAAELTDPFGTVGGTQAVRTSIRAGVETGENNELFMLFES